MDYNNRKPTKWNSDTTYALGPYKLLTRSIGIWPLDHFGKVIFLQVFLNSFIQCLIIIIFIDELITKGNCGLITDTVDALSLIATSILSVCKIILPLVYKKRMYFIVNSAIEDWANVHDKKSKTIMLKYAFAGRIVFIIQMIGAYMTIVPLIFGNPPTIHKFSSDQLSDNATMLRNIPIGPNCWVSTSISMSIYFAYYGLVTVHLVILCTAYIGGDVYIFGIAMHVCGQFKLLYTDMESLDGKKNFFSLRKQINQLSQRHTYLIKLANEFERTFNLIILLQVAANTFIIGISGILLLWGLKTGNSNIIIAALIRIYLLFFQLYIYSFIGESLSTQTRNLQLAIYNCKWYQMSPILAKDLLFIIMRTNYPFHLTAGKICNMNISSFKDLVKMMFSYFSIIRLMFEE
ncbi:odorant receptor 82a-like [Cotesia glomerata]|uniref:odorant receptor 82a-like n=1 Tax=Cotesia glomerata TaxID=32391 RepID=UPI001D025477|nr:odorant receptor 82a-like [Cotesia glomerata]